MKSGAGSRKNILHVIDVLDIGGAQSFILLMARFTPKERYTTSVCVLQPPQDLRPGVEEAGARVFALNRPRPSIRSPFRFLSYVWCNIRDIRRICGQEKIDIIHCHLSDAKFLGITAAKLARVPRIVATVHGPKLLPARRFFDPRNVLRRLATRLIFNRAKWIIAVSEETMRSLREDFGISEKRLALMTNGIDVEYYRQRPVSEALRRELGLSPGDRVLVCVGRLAEVKGQDLLARAMVRIAERHPGVRLLFVGDGELRPALEKQVRELGLLENVRFLGGRSDVADILAVSEVFVMPSRFEGTSLALLEAMARGMAIAATDIPGNRHVLEHGETAVLVEPENPDALARGVIALLDDPETGARYGQKAHEAVKRSYGIENTMRRLEELWN